MTTPATRAAAHTPRPAPASVARALADAFLDADDWTRSALVIVGARVLGARRRWLGPVVDEVLGGFRRAPVGSPRLLAALIAQAPAFLDAVQKADAKRTPLLIHHRELSPSQHPLDPPGALPPIRTVPELASLLRLSVGYLEWFADAKHWNRRARSDALHHYRYEWRARTGRVPRLLEIPEERMRRTQRLLLELLLGRIPVHDAAHGFVPGRSAVTGAARHTASDIVISLDLTSFFARVTAPRIYGTLRHSGYSESIAHIITGLCTNSVPPRVLAAMPPGGSADERFALRRALAAAHLPQGAPSSRGVRRIIEDEGHRVNPAKTRISRRGTRQSVTGIVVNQRTNVVRAEFDRLKATLHNCVVHGPAGQNRSGVGDFRAHLLGRISWVESLNPARGEKLRREFARIEGGRGASLTARCRPLRRANAIHQDAPILR